MRHERERRKISIASIAESTKILGALLEGLEQDDVSRWPVGLYRRAFFRAYAGAIGLDPETTLREFLEAFPEPEIAPLPAPATPQEPLSKLKVSVKETASWFVGGPILNRIPPRCSAVAFDTAVIGSVGVCIFVFTGMLWAPLSVATLGYYAGSILFLGNTPGVAVFAMPKQTEPPGSDDTDTDTAPKGGGLANFLLMWRRT